MVPVDTPLDTAIDTLRFSTAGSVDDGKSTLIGRLLFDADGILDDQLASLAGATSKHGHVAAGEAIDFSLLTDGLIAEREQGITIDVAYRYFTTARRRFIIADTPGHEQYTRNMVTGASTANLTIILVDATRGITMQSRRHAVIAGLLRIPHVVVAVNKMDLVGYAEDAYRRLREEFAPFIARLGFKQVTFIPVSALRGEMLANRGQAMPWFAGPTLLETLETSQAHIEAATPPRFAVQRVARHKFGPKQNLRGYQGRLDGGRLEVGDEVAVLPGAESARIEAIHAAAGSVDAVTDGNVATIVVDRQMDISRGSMLVKTNDYATSPIVGATFLADLCWLDVTPLEPARRYWIKQTTRSTRAVVDKILYRLNIETLDKSDTAVATLATNEVARVAMSTQQPLVFDVYQDNCATGSFILIDDTTNRTVAAGMITGATE